MNIWCDSYSSYGRSEYNDAKDEAKKHLKNIRTCGKQLVDYTKKIREKAAGLDSSFCGWKVTHKFRCKTKGGNSTLGEYVYIFDKDMKEILYDEDTEDKDVIRAKACVIKAIRMTEEEINELEAIYEGKE